MKDIQQKFSIWLGVEQARRFEEVMKRVRSRNRGRAEFGEVMRELMGFPPDEGLEPLLTDEDRTIIKKGIGFAQKKSSG